MGFLDERGGLHGKVAAVVGGGGGLGRAVALDFARAGMALALADRNEQLLTTTVDDVQNADAPVVHRVIDARDPDALAAFFDDLDREFARLDVLVNVVGGTFRQPFVETSPRAWDALIRSNFTWLLHSTQLAIVRMRAGGRGGSIMNITSIEAHRAAPGFAVYAGMKAAVTNFGRSLALELAPDGIRVNTIAPDMVPTEGVQGIEGSVFDESAASTAAVRASIPLQRLGRYEDVGNAALFLASDLSSYITGETLHPDGGAHASSGWFNWPGTGWANTPPAPAITAVAQDPKD
jgi:NAD(P)-dependent dehydrogenase (short-subunit alcohol dehydrogenase family)